MARHLRVYLCGLLAVVTVVVLVILTLMYADPESYELSALDTILQPQLTTAETNRTNSPPVPTERRPVVTMTPSRSTSKRDNSSDNNDQHSTVQPLISTVDMNPGCKKRALAAYIPRERAQNYQHPPIVHYSKFFPKADKGLLSFLEYTSMLSVYQVMKPERILIHSNVKFEGKYWDLTQKWDTIVTVNHIEKITSFGNVKVHYYEHMADYTKLSQVYKSGGVALDFDVIMINFTKLQGKQNLSACVLVSEAGAVRISLFSCIKGAPYIRTMLEQYHNHYNPGWIHNAGTVPTNLLVDSNRKDCYNVFVDAEVCKPSFLDVHKHWLKPGGVEWRKKFAAHYYKRQMKLSKDDESLLKGSSSFSEMLRSVYKM